jgi:hypothetical protein
MERWQKIMPACSAGHGRANMGRRRAIDAPAGKADLAVELEAHGPQRPRGLAVALDSGEVACRHQAGFTAVVLESSVSRSLALSARAQASPAWRPSVAAGERQWTRWINDAPPAD